MASLVLQCGVNAAFSEEWRFRLPTVQQMRKVKLQRLVEQFRVVSFPIRPGHVESVENVPRVLVTRRGESAPVLLI